MKKFSLFFSFFISIVIAFSAYPQKVAFKVGEKLVYEAAYNFHFIWVPAATATLSIKSGVYNSNNVFVFDAVASSLKSYDWLFKVRNKYASMADQTSMLSYWFDRHTCEGDKVVTEQYSIDHQKKQIYTVYKDCKKPLVIDTISFNTPISDAITAAYNLRNLDYSKLKKDEKINIPIVLDNRIISFYVRYKGKDVLVSHDKHFYNCHKFSALAIEGTVFKGGEDIFVWVSDDENHVPIQIEAKILIGSVKIQLRSTENLVYPFKAFIK